MLLKRRMLMQAGWPREALLITVVRDKKGDGHAVLTVKTDKGEFILDNQDARRSCSGRTPATASSSASRRAIRTSGSRSAIRGRRSRHRRRSSALSQSKELRDPGHVPTPPRPQTGFARGRRPPTPAATFFADAQTFSCTAC